MHLTFSAKLNPNSSVCIWFQVYYSILNDYNYYAKRAYIYL